MSFSDLERRLSGFVDSAINQGKWRTLDKVRQGVVRAYPKSRLKTLAMKEYVQGFGSRNRSFCYEVEWGTRDLGYIQGSTVSKFGVWYDKKSGAYDFARKFGVTLKQAYALVLDELGALIRAGEAYDLESIRKNKLSPMFKGKILFLYFPERYLNIFSAGHLHYFLDNLSLLPRRKEEIYLQERIMEFKDSIPFLADLTTVQFSGFLYEYYGYPPKEKVTVLAKNQINVSFIEKLPLSNGTPVQTSQNQSAGTGDYERETRKLKAIGDLGEQIVLDQEQQRLKRASIDKQVEHIAKSNDAAGYDILSYEDDGATPRYIEVKATTAKNLSRGFYLSENERTKSLELDNYYLYIVFDVRGNNPRIWMKKAPFEGSHFGLFPIQYQVFSNT